jgi:hypothetical protein
VCGERGVLLAALAEQCAAGNHLLLRVLRDYILVPRSPACCDRSIERHSSGR